MSVESFKQYFFRAFSNEINFEYEKVSDFFFLYLSMYLNHLNTLTTLGLDLLNSDIQGFLLSVDNPDTDEFLLKVKYAYYREDMQKNWCEFEMITQKLKGFIFQEPNLFVKGEEMYAIKNTKMYCVFIKYFILICSVESLISESSEVLVRNQDFVRDSHNNQLSISKHNTKKIKCSIVGRSNIVNKKLLPISNTLYLSNKINRVKTEIPNLNVAASQIIFCNLWAASNFDTLCAPTILSYMQHRNRSPR